MKQNLEILAYRLEETAQRFTISEVIEKIKDLENFQVSFNGGKSVKTFSTKKNWEGISPDVELFLDLHFDFQNILGSEKVTYKITKNTAIFYFYTTKFI